MMMVLFLLSPLIYYQLKICRVPAGGQGTMYWEMKSSSKNRDDTEINTMKTFEWVPCLTD